MTPLTVVGVGVRTTHTAGTATVTALQEGRVWTADEATNAGAKRWLLQVRERSGLP